MIPQMDFSHFKLIFSSTILSFFIFFLFIKYFVMNKINKEINKNKNQIEKDNEEILLLEGKINFLEQSIKEIESNLYKKIENEKEYMLTQHNEEFFKIQQQLEEYVFEQKEKKRKALTEDIKLFKKTLEEIIATYNLDEEEEKH